MDLTITIADPDLPAIARLLAHIATRQGEGDTHGLPTMRDLAQVLMHDVALAAAHYDTPSARAMRELLASHGYYVP